MFGFSAFERNKKDLQRIGVDNYGQFEHGRLMRALDENCLETVSARKFFNSRTTGTIRSALRECPEEVQAKKYCALLSEVVGNEIIPEPTIIMGGILDELDQVLYTLALAPAASGTAARHSRSARIY